MSIFNGKSGEEEKLSLVRMHDGQSGLEDDESLSLGQIYIGKTGGRGNPNLVRMNDGKSWESKPLNLTRMNDIVSDEHYMERRRG